MASFTKGKWKLVSGKFLTSTINPENSPMPKVFDIEFGNSEYYSAEERANARLIESAPDLYRLLVYVINNCDILDKDVEREINSVLDYVDGMKGGETCQ